jgi:hypothetical protein
VGYLRAVFETDSLLAVCAALDVEEPILSETMLQLRNRDGLDGE